MFMQSSARYMVNDMGNRCKDRTLYDFRDKKFNVLRLVEHNLNRTTRMFKWSGLPDTIPAKFLELYAQRDRHCVIAEDKGELYVFTGAPGGAPDVYYRPTIYTVANPALKLSKEYRIGKDCALLLNDSLGVGLLPILTRYATAIVENDLTMFLADINARINTLISATDETTKTSAIEFLADIEKGKLGVITDNAFIEALKTAPYNGSSVSGQLTELIEYEQYLKGSMWAELGLRENYNMKREAIGAGEAGLLNDILFPLVDDMLETRKDFCEEVNRIFGTNISVELGSAWKENKDEAEAEVDALKAEAEEPEQDEPEQEEQEEQENNNE